MVRILGAALLLAVACGDVTDRPSASEPGLGRATGTPCEPSFGEEHVQPRPGQAALGSQPVECVEVANDDRTLFVHFLGGREPCGVLDHVEVGYAAKSITITVMLGIDPGTYRAEQASGEIWACPDIGIPRMTTVRLPEPVRGRPVEDGSGFGS